MIELKNWSMEAVKQPAAEFRKLRDYRHHRIRDAHHRPSSNLWQRLHPTLRSGYKLALTVFGSAWLLCFIFTVWAGTTRKIEQGLVVTLTTGGCAAIRAKNFWIHLLINIIASGVYATSSYVLQRIVAPTRAEVDNIHKQGGSLSIGSLSVSNAFVLSRKKLITFSVLWISSLPLHLMANSALVYTSTNAEWSNYVLLQSEDILSGAQHNTTYASVGPDRSRQQITNVREMTLLYQTLEITQYLLQQQPEFEELDVLTCGETYASGASETWGDLILVLDDRIAPDWDGELFKRPFHGRLPSQVGQPWDWMCGSSVRTNCTPATTIRDGVWTVQSGYSFTNPILVPVARCLARRLPDACEINANLAIMIAIVVCITCKLIVTIVAIALSHDQPLITIGDAIASFLGEPPVDLPDSKASRGGGRGWEVAETVRKSRRARLAQETGHSYISQWAFILAAAITATVAFEKLFSNTVDGYKPMGITFTFTEMFRLGFGKMPTVWSSTISTDILIYKGSDVPATAYISGAVLSNLPQLALSALNLVFNNWLTRACTAFEFRSFALQRRGLRVSRAVPNTHQREAHFLQLPLRWSLLNLMIFVLLHTLASQTLFLRRVYAIWPQSLSSTPDIGKELVYMIGFSPFSNFALLILLWILWLVGTCAGFVSVDWMLPRTSGKSRYIANYCRPLVGASHPETQMVKWGVVEDLGEGRVVYAFSQYEVKAPQDGDIYSGVRRFERNPVRPTRPQVVFLPPDQMRPSS